MITSSNLLRREASRPCSLAFWPPSGCEQAARCSRTIAVRPHAAVRLQPASRCAGAPAPRPCDREHEPADAGVAAFCCASQEYFQLDRLVALLTGTNTINDLVVLNANQGDMAPIERHYYDSEEDIVPSRCPSQVDHLVGLLTGTKSVNQDDLILLSLNNKEKDLSTDKTVHRSNLARMRAQ